MFKQITKIISSIIIASTLFATSAHALTSTHWSGDNYAHSTWDSVSMNEVILNHTIENITTKINVDANNNANIVFYMDPVGNGDNIVVRATGTKMSNGTIRFHTTGKVSYFGTLKVLSLNNIELKVNGLVHTVLGRI